MVINRPVPFSGAAASAAASRLNGGKSNRRRRRSSGSTGGDDCGDGIVRAQAHALLAFRFLCRSGQLLLAEQLALSGVWDVGAAGGNNGGAGGDGNGMGAGTPESLGSLYFVHANFPWPPPLNLPMPSSTPRVRGFLGDHDADQNMAV